MNIIEYDPDNGVPTWFSKENEYHDNCKLVCKLLGAPEPESKQVNWYGVSWTSSLSISNPNMQVIIESV